MRYPGALLASAVGLLHLCVAWSLVAAERDAGDLPMAQGSFIFQPFSPQSLPAFPRLREGKWLQQVPTVLTHGMGDACSNPGMAQLTSIVGFRTKSKSICIGAGSNFITDTIETLTIPMDDQVRDFARRVRQIPELSRGFNAMGLSMGNLLLRGYISKFNDPPVLNFISIHGPHAGTASFPRCSPEKSNSPTWVSPAVCAAFDKLLGTAVYAKEIQSSLSVSNFFRDPLNLEEYKAKCRFLPDILDNATPDQRLRMLKLRRLVLVASDRDTMIYPRETSHFGTYRDNAPFARENVYNRTAFSWYKSLGLDELEATNRLILLSTPGDHLELSLDFFNTLIDRYFVGQVAEEASSLVASVA